MGTSAVCGVQEAEWLAAQLKQELPWVKLVVSLRDPISQALAMHLHNLAHNRTASCWDPSEQRAYQCVLESLGGLPAAAAAALLAWRLLASAAGHTVH